MDRENQPVDGPALQRRVGLGRRNEHRLAAQRARQLDELAAGDPHLLALEVRDAVDGDALAQQPLLADEVRERRDDRNADALVV